MELIPLKEKPEDIIKIVIQKLKRKFGKKLLFVGGKGSLANEEFTPLSDIDLVVAVSNSQDKYVEFMYGTTYFDIRIASINHLIKDIETVTMDWPLRVGGIMNLKLYYEYNGSFSKLKKTLKEVKKDKDKFEQAVDLNAVTEYYSKSYRAYKDEDYEQLFWVAFELYRMFAFSIALLNKEYFIRQGPMNFFNQISEFKYKPVGWKSASLLSMDGDPDNVFAGVEKIWKILNQLKKKHNFRSYDIQTLEDMEF